MWLFKKTCGVLENRIEEVVRISKTRTKLERQEDPEYLQKKTLGTNLQENKLHYLLNLRTPLLIKALFKLLGLSSV